MTIEERAEEYIKKNNLEWELECNRTSPIGEVKQAYIAGAKDTLKMKVNITTISDAPLEGKREIEEEKPYDYRSVIYAIDHIILGFGKDISPNLRNKLNRWKKNIQEELDKE